MTQPMRRRQAARPSRSQRRIGVPMQSAQSRSLGGAMNDTTEDFRATRLNDVSKLVAARVAPEQRATLQAFIERYYGQVDPEDLLERQPADLYGAALSH